MPTQKWSERIWVVTLGEQPGLSDDLGQLKEDLDVEAKPPDLVLDLSEARQFNSSNLSQLLRLRKFAIDHGTRLRLSGLTDPVWAVFLTTGLDKLFEFAGDVSTALAGLQIDEKR